MNREGSFWEIVGSKLKIVQTVALMEIVHATFGLVHSPVMTTTVQGASFPFLFIVVFSRVVLTWGYANACPDVQESLGVKLMVLRFKYEIQMMCSWSLVEVPRYLFYLVKLVNMPMPKWLLFLRYNLFLVLYPTGITGEILTIYHSLPFIKQTHLFSWELPNAWNFVFNFYQVSLFYLLLYIPCTIIV